MIKPNKTVLVPLLLAVSIGIGFLVSHNSAPKEFYQVPAKNHHGPAALSAALSELKIQVSPDEIAKLASTDPSGTTMLGLKQAAESLGSKATGCRITQRELEKKLRDGCSVIAFINGDHYVWVKDINSRGVVVKDIQPGFQFVPYDKWYSFWFETRDGKVPPPEKGQGICLILHPKSDSKT